MKIDSINRTEFIKPAKSNAAKAYEAGNAFKKEKDEVTFSSAALSFSKALSSAKAALAAETDNNKVAEIKDKVTSGSYFVPSDKIAESILAISFR